MAMAQVASAFPVHVPTAAEEQRILLHGVSWATYVMLRDTHESRHLRMTYVKGTLEIMSPSRRHAVESVMIARLLELFCVERAIPLFGYRDTTWRKEEGERGLEADDCYARDRDKEIPDIAIEVIVTHGLLDKLDVYRGLGIREVWMFENGVFTVVTLRGEYYEPIAASEIFPEVDLVQIARFVLPDQNAALMAFRDELHRNLATS
jgi:Uma2 family endonuclease